MRNALHWTIPLLAVLGLGFPDSGRAQVTRQRIEKSASEPENWLTYNGGYDSKRFSTLEYTGRRPGNRGP